MGNNWTTQIPGDGVIYGAQLNYDYINSSAYKTFIYGTNIYRKGVRDSFFVTDIELYPGGFLHAENVGWRNITKMQ